MCGVSSRYDLLFIVVLSLLKSISMQFFGNLWRFIAGNAYANISLIELNILQPELEKGQE